ncbi:oxygen-insensitive NAD(P)H nitroreductase [Clostridium estertheticum]|uniref:oxygen-insensitive NAD(P)H nitroreductase n=1 Tax=Clostridium estertheticum TaxID=238834 RepID=UPI001C0D313B|nr:oxygen-insensitive NAD(P)H nitroreductase [Clostridium estertheticum]MBU3178617.1 oxygen-insensitive NAD(P)H nitroreductase [Clostridium estertheticum]
MNLIEILNTRYSAKEFDSTKKISDEDFIKIKALLRLSASSVNAQPWHFVIANTDEGKKQISKSTQGFFNFNEAKVLEASHVVVFCSRTDMDEEYLLHVLEKEDADGRFTEKEFKDNQHMGRSKFVNIHRDDEKDLQNWMEKQVYLNIGNLLLGVAALGIDAVPMEGFDKEVLDEELGLRKKGYTAVAIVGLGYRSDNDFNAELPKSRLKEDEIITII